MEKERQRSYTVIAIVALVAVVLSCAVGALAGGVAGYFTGQRQGQIAAQRALAQRGEVTPLLPERPWRRWGEIPLLPEPGEELLPTDRVGAVLVEVIPGMPADEAGLRVGDVIVAIDQIPINRNHSLADVIAQYEPGDRISVSFWRGDRQERAVVRLAENPDAPNQAYLGVRFQMNLPGD
jgi:S1-C subfamily serine protease